MLPYEDFLQRNVLCVPDWNGHSLLFCALDTDPAWELCGTRLPGLCSHLVAAVCGGRRSQGGLGSLRDVSWSGDLFRYYDRRDRIFFPRKARSGKKDLNDSHSPGRTAATPVKINPCDAQLSHIHNRCIYTVNKLVCYASPIWRELKSTNMTLNRRYKAILFVTLVVSGCALLRGAELREALGFMMLGIAFAWSIGSSTASKCTLI